MGLRYRRALGPGPNRDTVIQNRKVGPGGALPLHDAGPRTACYAYTEYENIDGSPGDHELYDLELTRTSPKRLRRSGLRAGGRAA